METRVVIVGAGGIGCELATRLMAKHQVILVENRDPCAVESGVLVDPAKELPKKAGERGILGYRADGTSRLVLQSLFDRELHCALVVVAGDDEINLESGRLGRELGFDPVIAVQHDREHLEAYRQANITALDRTRLLADVVERSLRQHGAVVPSGIGLGLGELVEIRLVRTSPVLGRPLKRLAPFRWRVAAVFRGEELIVPTGETTLAVDDRVLLVGDPRILRTVAEYLRLGTPQFPQPFGPNVVTCEFSGSDEKLMAEAAALACASGAYNLRRGAPDAEDTELVDEIEPLTAPLCKGDVARGTFSLLPLDHQEFWSRIKKQRPGVVMVRAIRRSLAARALGLRGDDAELCDRLPVPVVFARGSTPYKRILLPVSGSDLDIPSAEMAIDITRQLGGSLTAVNVDLPRYISGLSEEAIHQEVVPIRKLCELYEVPLTYRHHEGNPVRHILAECQHHDLVVMTRRMMRRDTFFDPDVALRIARRAPCSVIVLTHRPEE